MLTTRNHQSNRLICTKLNEGVGQNGERGSQHSEPTPSKVDRTAAVPMPLVGVGKAQQVRKNDETYRTSATHWEGPEERVQGVDRARRETEPRKTNLSNGFDCTAAAPMPDVIGGG